MFIPGPEAQNFWYASKAIVVSYTPAPVKLQTVISFFFEFKFHIALFNLIFNGSLSTRYLVQSIDLLFFIRERFL
jgi:hypothetical protein